MRIYRLFFTGSKNPISKLRLDLCLQSEAGTISLRFLRYVHCYLSNLNKTTLLLSQCKVAVNCLLNKCKTCDRIEPFDYNREGSVN